MKSFYFQQYPPSVNGVKKHVFRSVSPFVRLISMMFLMVFGNQLSAQVSGNAPATLNLPITNGTNIQWYKDGAIVSGANATNYSATAAGVYYAKYDDPSACTGRTTMTITLTVVPTADLSLTATPLTMSSNKGETQQYLITVTNSGPNTAPNATVSVPIPNGRTFLAAQASQGTYDSGTKIWTVGSLANGANATMVLSLQVD